MGNFSRNTFDPLKDYVAVRLQQGVPVLDADWNELNDVIRQELYDGFALTFTDGMRPGGADFAVQESSPGTNDFQVLAGAALVRGRLVRVHQNLRYSTQPWTDPGRAARDGVAVIPPLTTPTGAATTPPRTDIVYLDIWEREVGSAEDASLINPAIGVETCVRLKREVAVRVAEGTTTLPSAPANHVFLPLALLQRATNQATIPAGQIQHKRPFIRSPQGGIRFASFLPAFVPINGGGLISGNEPAWRLTISFNQWVASNFFNQHAIGILPLILPDGARLNSFTIKAVISSDNSTQLHWQLVRNAIQTPAATVEVLLEDTFRTAGGFERIYNFSSPRPIVDNSRHFYAILANTVTPSGGPPPQFSFVNISGVLISYEHFDLVRPNND